MAFAPQLAWPVRLTAEGVIATVPQDSEEDLSQSIAIAFQYEPGTRRLAPDYGIPSQLFVAGNPDLGAIQQAIARSDPRVRANPQLAQAVTENLLGKVDLDYDGPTG